MRREKQPLIYHNPIQILGLFVVKLEDIFCHTPIILTSIMFMHIMCTWLHNEF